ncbi:hypothetical protein V1478_005071 [Vespula squamosa]|uniref:Uncharacterized protein n=1 Tax=Vespula squamosa TaxID=30214 RepID=A0ABD2BD34_VESSQ
MKIDINKLKHPTSNGIKTQIPPPMYIHSEINKFFKLIQAINQQTAEHFKLFKEYCTLTDIQYHKYSVEQDKIIAAYLGKPHRCFLPEYIRKNTTAQEPLYNATIVRQMAIRQLIVIKSISVSNAQENMIPDSVKRQKKLQLDVSTVKEPTIPGQLSDRKN